MSSIAILIDCWPGTNLNAIKNIKQYCVDNTSIKTICLSSYNSKNTVSPNQPYWNNSNHLFNKQTKWRHLKQEWCNAEFDKGDGTAPELLEDWRRPDQLLICAFSSLQILYYCNFVDRHIDKIYFFGAAWDVCIRNKPTGWMEINALNYHKLFHTRKTLLTRPECVCDTENKLINANVLMPAEDSDWHQLPNGDYYLSKTNER